MFAKSVIQSPLNIQSIPSSPYLHTHFTKSHSHKLPNKVATLHACWILGIVSSSQNCENHTTFFNQFLCTTLEKTREISLKLVVVSSRNIWWACSSYIKVPPVVLYTLRNLSIINKLQLLLPFYVVLGTTTKYTFTLDSH